MVHIALAANSFSLYGIVQARLELRFGDPLSHGERAAGTPLDGFQLGVDEGRPAPFLMRQRLHLAKSSISFRV